MHNQVRIVAAMTSVKALGGGVPTLCQEDLHDLIGGQMDWHMLPPHWQVYCGRLATALFVDPVLVLVYLLPVFAYLCGPTAVLDSERADKVGDCQLCCSALLPLQLH